MVEAVTEFRKSSFNDEDSANLAYVASLLQNVADEQMSAGDAASFLIAEIKAFNIEAEDAMTIIDQINEVSNNFAVSSGDLVKSLGIVASTSAAVGNSMSETLAMTTAITQQTRNASKAARGLNTIFSRYSQILDDTSSTGKKLTEIFDGLNIALYDQDGQIRSTYDILKDLAGKWGNLSKNEQEYIALISSGANQLNNFLALMNGFDDAVKANETALNAQGSAVKENSRYMESLEAQLQKLKSAWEAFSNSVIQSDFVKFFLSAGTSVLKAFNNDIGVTVTQFGLLTGVLTGAISLIGQFGTNLTAAIPALSKFSASFTALGASSPLVAAGISAIVVVIITLIEKINAMNQKAEDAVKYSKQLTDAFENFDDSVEQSNRSVAEEALNLRILASRLDVLQRKTELNDEEQKEFDGIISTLNDKIPDLNLAIDETTGKLSIQTKEIYKQIDAWEELAMKQAYLSAVSKKREAYAQAQIDLQSLKAQREDIVSQEKTIVDMYGIVEPSQKNRGRWRKRSKIEREKQAELDALYEQHLTLNAQIENLEKALSDYEKDYKAASEQADKLIKDLGLDKQEAVPDEQEAVPKITAPEQQTKKFNYSDWLKEQKHLLNTGKLLAANYYASLQAMLNKYTDESIISTEERWDAEEEIYKYQQNLTKEQRQAYEKAVRDAESAAKAKAQAEKQAISDIKTAFTAWQDEQDYLLTTGQITEVEYYDNLRAKNDELFKDKEDFQSQYWTNLEKIYKWEQQQIEDQKKAKVTEFDEWLKAQDHALAMGEISEEEYYTELKEKNDEYFKDSMENLDKYWKNEESWYKWKKQQIEEIHEAAKAALDAEIEKEKQRLELKKTEAETRKAQLAAQQDEIERLGDYVQTIADAEIDKIDEKISALKDEADAITAKYKEQIDALEEQNQAIDDQITKQKLLEALAKAQQSKKYVFKDGRFQYVDDVDAIASAQEQLDEFNREQALQEKTKQLEKQRDLELEQNQLAQKALEDEKKRWEEYKQGWSNITNAYTEQQNALLAQQKLGIDVEKATWNERLSNLESFKNQYISLAAQIKAAEAEIAGYDAQISAVGSAENQDATIRRMMKENSEAWHQTSDASERERLHEMNEYLNSLLSNKGTYNAASGQWSNLSYTQSQPLSSSIGSVGVMTPSASSSAVLGSSLINKGISGAKQALSQIFNMGNISLPNVSNAKQFVSELKNLALQAAYSRA